MDKPHQKGNLIGYLLESDKSLSSALSLSATKSSALGQYRGHMKGLEYSCHGVFWISASIILLWFSDDPLKEAFFFNLLIALILDIIFVGILKAAIARPRPDNNESNDMLMTFSVDKMSCPSGHTSRAVMLTCTFILSTPGMNLLHMILIVWCLCTCASRILLGRHHVGDVLIGMILGYVEYIIMDYIWAGPDTAKWYLDIFKDSNSVVDDF